MRDQIHLEDQEAKAQLIEVPGQEGRVSRLGVIDLPSFYSGSDGNNESQEKSVTADVVKLVSKLKREKVQGIILDLRRNGGGSLQEAISLTGLFIKRGPVVQTKAPNGEVRVESDRDAGNLYDGPLVVLTSRFSASASEILAGALQDYGRALIVGDTSTFGKGTVQSMLPLSDFMERFGLSVHDKTDPGVLKLTIRKFYRPDGSSTQLKGVASDIVLPSPTGVLKEGEAEMPDPLPWDSVPAAPHVELNRVAPWLPALREASARRLAASQDFIWMRQDDDRIKAQLDNPVVSLNEKQRRQEKTENEARVEARKKERAARPNTHETRYEITLKNADQSGLSEPAVAHSDAAENVDAQSDLPGQTSTSKELGSDSILEETQHILLDYITLLKEPTNGTASVRSGTAS